MGESKFQIDTTQQPSMPVFTSESALRPWLDQRLDVEAADDTRSPLRALAIMQVVCDGSDQLKEFVRPAYDSPETAAFYKSFRQPLVMAVTASTLSGSTIIVLVEGLQYRFLLDPGAASLRDVRAAAARVARTASISEVQRLPVSSAPADESGENRERVRMYEIATTTLEDQGKMRSAFPCHAAYHLDPLVRRGSTFEQSAGLVALARAGITVNTHFVCRGARLCPPDTASGVRVLRVDASNVDVVEGNNLIMQCAWDLETYTLSAKIPRAGICMFSAAFFRTPDGADAVISAGVCSAPSLLKEHVEGNFPAGIPPEHAIIIVRSEFELVTLLMREVLSRAPFSFSYNGFGFDHEYLTLRITSLGLGSLWSLLHWLPGSCARVQSKKMSSRAMGNLNFCLILAGGRVISDLLQHAQRNARFTPGNLGLKHVCWTTFGVTKSRADHTATQRVAGDPLRFPVEYTSFLSYAGQDALLLMMLALPFGTVRAVLGPLGVRPEDALRVLRVLEYTDIPKFFPVTGTIEEMRDSLRADGVEVVLADYDEEEGIDSGLLMLRDGTCISCAGPDWYNEKRSGLGGTAQILALASLCCLPNPALLLSHGQQLRMVSLVYMLGVVGFDGLIFVFDHDTAHDEDCTSTFEGGAVEVLAAAIYYLLCYIDASGMYPNLIRQFGISPENKNEDVPEALFPQLLLPAIVMRLLSFRKKMEQERRAHEQQAVETGSAFHEAMASQIEKQIAAVKGTINSVFGFMGSHTNAFGNWSHLAASITRHGREQIGVVKTALNRMDWPFLCSYPDTRAVLEKHQLLDGPPVCIKNVYGDTDSGVANIRRVDGAWATHVSYPAAVDLFRVVSQRLPDIVDRMGMDKLMLLMAPEYTAAYMLGCAQSKTYAAMVLKKQTDGTFTTFFEGRGFSVRRGDRYPCVRSLQRWGLEHAMTTVDQRESMMVILQRTYELMENVREACAPTHSYADMSVKAQNLLPQLRRLVVWNGGSEHAKGASPQDVVAAIIRRDGRFTVRSGEKVAVAIQAGTGVGTAKSRALPAYQMLSKSNPRGPHHDPKPVLAAIRAAMSRVVAALLHVMPSEAVSVIDAYTPGQTALGDGVFAPAQPVREAVMSKRRKITLKESAARTSKRVDEMMGMREGAGEHTVVRRAHRERAEPQQQKDLLAFFSRRHPD
jgi:DNA polymerase elongation subunit (family B)